MKAALFRAFNGPLTVETVADPDCPRDGAVVRVLACGVCRSDWHGWTGADSDVAPPHVPGHEFAGEVVAVGPDCRRWRVGERVTAPFILSCGSCPDCLGGEPTICADQHVVGFSSWGAFAELIAVPHADFNLVRLPEGADPVAIAGMGCRVTTAFRGLTDRGGLKPGEWLSVHGSGGVGLSAVMIGAAMGARVLAIDVNPAALDMARSLGATAVLDARSTDTVGMAVREITGGGAHLSIDALGRSETFADALGGLRKLGRHVQLGMPTGRHERVELKLLELVYSRQISIAGSRGMAASRFSPLLAMISAGRLDPGRLVTRRIGLAQAGAALADFTENRAVGITVIDFAGKDL
jgi:alcohol dehydrogenase